AGVRRRVPALHGRRSPFDLSARLASEGLRCEYRHGDLLRSCGAAPERRSLGERGGPRSCAVVLGHQDVYGGSRYAAEAAADKLAVRWGFKAMYSQARLRTLR